MNEILFDTGFMGNSSYNSALTALGYSVVTTNALTTSFTFFKPNSNTTFIKLSVLAPLENSTWNFKLKEIYYHPGPTATPTTTIPPTPTPTPTLTLTPTVTPTISLTPTITPTVSLTPNEPFEPTRYTIEQPGIYSIPVNLGTSLSSTVTISFDTYDVPDRIIIWENGPGSNDLGNMLYDTGFRGNPAYNPQLAALGYPPVAGDRAGTFTFNHSGTWYVTLSVVAPLHGTTLQIDVESDIIPTLPGSPAIWLDSSSSEYVLDASDNPCTPDTPVKTWLDRSLNNRHFTMDSISNRPVLSSYLGMNYIKFNSANFTSLTGNANALTFTNGAAGVTLIALTQFGNSNSTPFPRAEAVFANTIPTQDTLRSRIKFMSNPASIDPAIDDRGTYFSAGGRRLDSDVQDGGAPATLATATQKNILAPGVFAAAIDYTGAYSTTVPPSGTVSIFFNGVTAGYDPAFQTAGTVSPTDANKAAIGRRFIAATPYYHNGIIGEFVAYDRLLTPVELNYAYLYLKNKWGLIP